VDHGAHHDTICVIVKARLIVFCLGFGVSLAGDACHVASGTTVYDWGGVPTLWKSAVWFPFLVGFAILGAAEAGARAELPGRSRDLRDVVLGAAAVLGLYAFTATLRGQPDTVSVVLVSALAVAIWAWWDPSPGCLVLACGAAVAGPVAEMLICAAGASHYASNSDALGGVAPWLPALYFAAGAVASGILRPLEVGGGGARAVRRRAG
jgi:hypothetical protein